jgi:ComF family protein
MQIKTEIIGFLEEILFLGNGTCPICGKVLFITKKYLCFNCEQRLPVNQESICKVCGRPLFSTIKDKCKDCAINQFPFSGGYVWLHYYHSGKKLVGAIKFNDRPHLGSWAGEQMGQKIAHLNWAKKIDFLIPIPLHPNRIEARGYNQSEKIAQGILVAWKKEGHSEALNYPSLSVKDFVRVRDTPHQIGQSRNQRLQNLSGAFSLKNSWKYNAKTILLVDDVITTGGTLAEAARTLLAAGAKEIYITTLAGVSE